MIQNVLGGDVAPATYVLCPFADLPNRAARSRVDAAEAAGRAREEQLEMLHAVRQYMAQQQAKLMATQCVRTC